MDERLIHSICDGFANALNEVSGELCCSSQDAYEVLSMVFGDAVTESQLRNCAPQQYQQLATSISEFFEWDDFPVTSARKILESALSQWSGA
jgi:Fe-S-cluster formation regulator IscX/YfhJ